MTHFQKGYQPLYSLPVPKILQPKTQFVCPNDKYILYRMINFLNLRTNLKLLKAAGSGKINLNNTLYNYDTESCDK